MVFVIIVEQWSSKIQVDLGRLSVVVVEHQEDQTHKCNSTMQVHLEELQALLGTLQEQEL